MYPIISKGAALPAKGTITTLVPKTNQTSCSLNIYEGERPLTKHCHLLSNCNLSGIPSAEGNTYEIELTLTLETSFMFRAEAVLIENSTGKIKNKLSASKTSFGYSGNDFEKLKQRAEDFAEEDNKEVDRIKKLFDLKSWCQNLDEFFKAEQKNPRLNDMIPKTQQESLTQMIEKFYNDHKNKSSI